MDIDFTNPAFVTPPPSQAMSPQDQNWISPSGFILVIHRNKALQFNCQKVEIPDTRINFSTFPTPLLPIPLGGHPLEFGELFVEFKIDSQFANWFEIYKWERAISFITCAHPLHAVGEALDQCRHGLDRRLPDDLGES